MDFIYDLLAVRVYARRFRSYDYTFVSSVWFAVIASFLASVATLIRLAVITSAE